MEGFGDEFSRFVGYILYNVIDIWLMWKLITTYDQYKFILKGLIIIFCVSGIYGGIESLLEVNPILEYKSELIPEGLSKYGIDDFRGYRATSIFEHPIAMGMNFSLFVILVINHILHDKLSIANKFSVYLLILICIYNVFLTKMRSGMVFLIIMSFSMLNFSSKKTYGMLLGLGLFLVMICAINSDMANIFLSIFSEQYRDAAGGSSIDMRIEQLEACIQIMRESFFTGLGERFVESLNNAYISDALGFESVIFEELTKHGVIGMLTTLFLMIYSVIYIPYKQRNKKVLFITLAYWCTYVLTSVPFFRFHLYYFLIFILLKSLYAGGRS